MSTKNARLASDLTRAKDKLARVTFETRRREEALKVEKTSRAQVISSQGSLMQATVYKLLRTNVFGEYVNAYGSAINPLATTETIELISQDFPDMDIKKSDYRYDKAAKEQSGWHMAEAMLRVSSFPLLDSLKSNDRILSPKEILKSEVDEDSMFMDLDKIGHVYSLGPPMSPHRPDLLVALP